MKKRIRKLKNDKFLNFIVFPLLLILLIDLFFKLNGIAVEGFSNKAYLDIFVSIFKNPLCFLTLYLFIVGINALLIVVFNNSKISKIILIILTIILMTVNDFKYRIMGLPIRLSDIYFLNASNETMMVDFMKSVKGSWILITILKDVVLIGLLVFLINRDKKVHTHFKTSKSRIIIAIISLILILIPWIDINSLQRLYINNFYNDEKLIQSKEEEVYYQVGFLEGIHYFYLKDNCVNMDGYSKRKAKKVLAQTKYENYDKWGKPNVIYILSESLSDANNLKDVEFDTDLLKNIRGYNDDDSDKTYSFEMLAPSYGGASVNAEFQILTGANLTFFSPGFIPYNQLYNINNGSHLPNIIKEYNNNGYYTEYLTVWGPDSYHSSFVYEQFGVDKKTYGKDLKNPEKKGQRVSDEYLTNLIIKRLEEKPSKKKFMMVATGQNHAPYNCNRYDEFDIDVVDSKYNDEDTCILKTYAQGVYDADKELNRLYEEIQDIDQPTIVILFGDHQPYVVNSDSDNLYLSDSYYNHDDKIEFDFQYHRTPVAIVSNYDIDVDDLKIINSNYLGSYILSHLDLKISNYFKFVDYNMRFFPVYNRFFIYQDDKLLTVNDLSKKEREIYKNIELVQHYKFFDYDK